jgi:hypothetical protein
MDAITAAIIVLGNIPRHHPAPRGDQTLSRPVHGANPHNLNKPNRNLAENSLPVNSTQFAKIELEKKVQRLPLLAAFRICRHT